MRVAVIHYWLLYYRGGERVLRAILDIFPKADIYTLFADKKLVSRYFPTHSVHTSSLDRIPFKKALYHYLLPLMPAALERFELEGYDLIISSESGPAKGIIPPPSAKHLCYCHSPMRYLWDLRRDYLSRMSPLTRSLFRSASHRLRIWDTTSSTRVDSFLANSGFVRDRIEKYYRRKSVVVHPPLDIAPFFYKPEEGYYFILSHLVPYKRIDLAVEAFNRLGIRLVIAGGGPEAKRLRRQARENIQFTGPISHPQSLDLYARCRAFVFPGKEDFGLTPLEALASGKPVIAYKSGGVEDTLTEKTAVFFHSQTPQALEEAVLEMEKRHRHFKRKDLVNQAKKFSPARFKRQFAAQVDRLLGGRHLEIH